MPWIGTSFTRGFTWVSDVAIPVILRSRHDANDNDFAGGIDDCINKNGANRPTIALPMAGFNHTNVGNATARNQYLTMGQYQDTNCRYVLTTGVAPTFVATLSPAITAYVTGQVFVVQFNAAAAGSDTINFNGLGAVNILYNGMATIANAWATNAILHLTYDGTNFNITGFLPSGSLNAETPQSYIEGMKTSNGTDTTNDIDFAAGIARSSDNSLTMSNSSIMTKRKDADWAPGTNQGGMPSTVTKTGTFGTTITAVTGIGSLFTTEFQIGDVLYSSTHSIGRRITVITDNLNMTIESAFPVDVVSDNVQINGQAPNCTYYFFAIAKNNGVTDFGFDTRVDASLLLADTAVVANNFIKYRRVWANKTNSSNIWIQYRQRQDYGELITKEVLTTTAPSTGSRDAIETVAPVSISEALMIAFGSDDDTTVSVLYSSFEDTYIAVTTSNADFRVALAGPAEQGQNSSIIRPILVDNLGQIYQRANSTLDGYTLLQYGWIDRRGKE